MGLVIDTSALIARERLPSGSDPFGRLDEEVVLPAIVWAEALVGVRMANSVRRAARRQAGLESLCRVVSIEPFTPEIAGRYADIFSELSEQGESIPQNDLQIAATARHLDFGVLVGPKGEKHYRRVYGLRLVRIGEA